MQIYQGNFQTIFYFAEKQRLEALWHNTPKMEDTFYREEVIKQLDYIQQYKPAYLLLDTSQFHFRITLETQQWTGSTVFPQAISAGVTKIALLVSQDFLAQMSIEKNMEKEKTGQMIVRYFDKRESAIRWLEE
jgi:hypothetical protein